MTYGTLDGTLPPAPTPPPYQPQTYSGSHTGAPGDVPPVSEPTGIGDGPKPPTAGGGGKDVAVDTVAMKTVAANVLQLCEAAKRSYDQLDVDVHPGAFGQANTMRTRVNGVGADFKVVLDKLGDGLTDLSKAMTDLARKYEDTEDDNTVKGTDVTKAMQDAATDFGAIPTAHSTDLPT